MQGIGGQLLSGGLFSSSFWKPGTACLLPRDTALSWWIEGAKLPLLKARPSSQTALSLLCWRGPWEEWQKHLGWVGDRGLGIPKSWALLDSGGAQVWRTKILCWPPSESPTHTQYRHRAPTWDGNSSNKLGHPLSLGGRGSWGGGLGIEQRRWLPTSHWAVVYTQVMSWLLASSPAHLARCARRGWLFLPGPSQHSRFQSRWEKARD